MAAVRRSRGSGTLIALVVFVLLTFISIGAAVYYAMKASTAVSQLKENQQAFEEAVVSYYRDQGWEVPTAQDPGVYDVRYDSSTYGAVATRLQDAATFQQMASVTGWESPDAVQDLLQNSPLAQDREASFETISGLLQAYGQSYEDLNSRVAQLNQQIKSLKSQLDKKDQALNEALAQKRQQLNKASDTYQQKMKERRQKYQALLEAYQKQRDQTEKWRQQYKQTVQQNKKQVSQLEKDLEDWRQMYRRLRMKGEKEQLRPGGKVLAVKPDYGFLVVAGGRKQGRKRDQKLVVYQETLAGQRERKATVVVTNVYDHTASASVISRQGNVELEEGDLVATLSSWEEFEEQEQGQQTASAQN